MPHIPIENAPSAIISERPVAIQNSQLPAILSALLANAPELAAVKSQQGVQVANLVLSAETLSFTLLENNVEKSVAVAIPKSLLVDIQKILQADTLKPTLLTSLVLPKALLKMSDTSLSITPQLSPIPLTKNVVAQLVMDAVNSRLEKPLPHNTQINRLTFSGNVNLKPKTIIAEHPSTGIELKLNENLRPLLKPMQSVLFELKTSHSSLQLDASLAKNTSPIESVPFNQKRIRQLFTNIQPNLKVFLKEHTATVKINTPIALPKLSNATSLGWVKGELDALGDVTKIRLRPAPIVLKLATNEPIIRPGLNPKTLFSKHAQSPNTSLSSIREITIQNVANLPKKWLTTVQNELQRMFALPKHISTNQQTKKLISPSVFNVNLPPLKSNTPQSNVEHSGSKPLIEPSEVSETNTTQSTSNKNELAVKPDGQAKLVYGRPTLIAELKQQSLAQAHVKEFIKPNGEQVIQTPLPKGIVNLEAPQTDQPLIPSKPKVTLPVSQHINNVENLAKHLPKDLNDLVCQAFNRMISPSAPTSSIITQLQSQLAPFELPLEVQLETIKGAMQHLTNTLALTSSASTQQTAALNQIDNLLAVLFKALGVTKKESAKDLISATNHSLLQQLTKESANATAAMQPRANPDKATESENRPNIVFDVPVKLEDKTQQIGITVERDAKKVQQVAGVNVWHIQLAFSIAEQPLIISAELAGKQLALLFESSDPHLLSKTSQYQEELAEKLASHGIDVTKSERKLNQSLSHDTKSGIVNIRI